ncbi:MAG TPA: choice-of-anchor Q domain-containing protein, partial [Cytophagaceae bacterium]
ILDNGGFSPTMALAEGSPAINKGGGCTPKDQRGAPRVGICDIGAIEFNSTLTTMEYRSSLSSFRIYPNPSIDNQIKIAAIDKTTNKTVRLTVFDALGNTVLINENVNLGDEYTLSLASLASGIYTLHIQNGEETFRGSFVK